MRPYALLIGAGLIALTAGTAQSHEWGGGRCIGFGCAHDGDDDGYRDVRGYGRDEDDDDLRPGIGRHQHRVHRRDDWEDDDED